MTWTGIGISGTCLGPTGPIGQQGSPGVTGFYGPKYIPDTFTIDKENYLICLRYYTDKAYIAIKYQGDIDTTISKLLDQILSSSDGLARWGSFLFTIKNKQLNVGFEENILIDKDSTSLAESIISKLHRMYEIRIFL